MDKDNQDYNTETEPEDNFEELLNQSIVDPVFFNPGEKVEAVITTVTKDGVFIDLGGKTEGYVAVNEFMDDENNITIKEGDTINAYFLSSRNNEMLFTTCLSGDTTGNEHLEDAYRNRIPLEGLVEKEIKGGFEVKIAGNIRAFCPYSQMGLHRVKNSDQYIGQNLTFKIIEYSEKGRNIIISNRTVLEEERQEQKDALMESLEEGMTVSGEITSIQKFGAFVDIGGIEGLIPISEISWGRVEDINGSLSVGQKVDVAIKKLDWGNDKFSFSLKEILPNPWDDIGLKYPEGSSHTGKVVRLAPFGAFVTLEPGIDGLVHISELGKGKRINHPREVLEENQTIEVKISRVDEEEKRLSLAMVSNEQDSEDSASYKKYMAGTSKKSSGSFSTLGDILRAKMEENKD
ncbi:MAG: 30S ribosomal protein S1 [Deltaproteobacteria bacterium]|nr:30S ribosomal protein S1 [Deltaproteobacteria bacterium]